MMTDSGLRVPGGFCVTAEAYERFIEETGLRGRISIELGRKRLEDMRWEEMWDAALRIRNMFLAAYMPGEIRAAISKAASPWMPQRPVAVRSASLAEDSEETSFAGLHESYLNLRGAEAIIKHVRLVWASLWSDAALAYSRELSLDPGTSSMAVIVQEMVLGDKSGVAFGVDPQNSRRAVIESVYGLNKGLVDGDVEADRWTVDRKSGEVRIEHTARHMSSAVPFAGGVRIEKLDDSLLEVPVLDGREVSQVFSMLMKAGELFGAPQDMEWTFRDGELYILQARPITTVQSADADERRSYDLSLRRSFDNLRRIGDRIEKEHLPAMEAEAADTAAKDLGGLDDDSLAAEIESRSEAMERWRKVYWDEFIPFAHGVRLFGQVYNDRLNPEDPFDFIDLLAAVPLKSMERNRKLAGLAAMIENGKDGEELDRRLDELVEEFAGLSCSMAACDDERDALRALASEMAGVETVETGIDEGRIELLEKEWFAAFGKEERERAADLLALGRTSYRLRDDDNIYLGRFESNLTRALEESRRRLGERCADEHACSDAEEVIRALRLPDYVPEGRASKGAEQVSRVLSARQLKGQPAGAGIAKGIARVIDSTSDLFEVKRGEILVCDSIDPNMTFVVPLVSAIVERRGGMLIHGAIIAREYGLPCVTGIPDATRYIRSGVTITVDGYYGLVIIHNE
jgi:pyruvate,water dikinase